MTDTTKAFLKHTILGLLGGGAASAIYTLSNSKGTSNPSEPEFKKDEIVVPLSRRNFLKAVRPERLGGGSKSKPSQEDLAKAVAAVAAARELPAAPEPAVTAEEVGKMSPKDLASLKKALLRKNAGDCSGVKKVTTTSSATMPVRRIAGAGSTYPRDKKGRFVSEPRAETTKSAGIGSFLRNVIPGVDSTLSDAGDIILNNAGLIGGISTGLIAAKMVSDRIMINKKKKQVEEARKRYVDTLAREVNDEDVPYYSKSAADHGILGSALGYLGLAGLVTGTTAGIVMYRVMENRRKEAEKAKDKDLAKYPYEKAIRFKFPDVQGQEKAGFFG